MCATKVPAYRGLLVKPVGMLSVYELVRYHLGGWVVKRLGSDREMYMSGSELRGSLTRNGKQVHHVAR